MKINCKLIREGGTHVTIGKKEYHFAPDENGNHVAEVADKAHIERFLSIEEAYEEAKATKTEDTKAVEKGK